MIHRFAATAVAGALMASPAMAAEECLVGYGEFEEHVPHIDLERCPQGHSVKEEGFCRLSFHGAEVVIYGFEPQGEKVCLVWARVEKIERLFK